MSKDNWFLKLLREPAITIERRAPEVHNHYYLYQDNRVIKVNEQEFKNITKGKLIENKTKFIQYNG